MNTLTMALSVIALIVTGILIYAMILSRRKNISFLRALFLYKVCDLELSDSEFNFNHSHRNFNHQHEDASGEDTSGMGMDFGNIYDRTYSPYFSHLSENTHHTHEH